MNEPRTSEGGELSLADFEAELTEAERRVAALRLIVNGLRTLNGSVPLLNRHVGVREQIVALLHDGRVWTRSQLVAESLAQGWIQHHPSHNQMTKKLDAAIRSAIDRDQIERVAPATYRIKGE